MLNQLDYFNLQSEITNKQIKFKPIYKKLLAATTVNYSYEGTKLDFSKTEFIILPPIDKYEQYLERNI